MSGVWIESTSDARNSDAGRSSTAKRSRTPWSPGVARIERPQSRRPAAQPSVRSTSAVSSRSSSSMSMPVKSSCASARSNARSWARTSARSPAMRSTCSGSAGSMRDATTKCSCCGGARSTRSSAAIAGGAARWRSSTTRTSGWSRSSTARTKRSRNAGDASSPGASSVRSGISRPSTGRTASSTCCQKSARSDSRSGIQTRLSPGRARSHDVSSTVFPAPGGPETSVSAPSRVPASSRSKSRGRGTTDGGGLGRCDSIGARTTTGGRREARCLGAVLNAAVLPAGVPRTGAAHRPFDDTSRRAHGSRPSAYRCSSESGEALSPTGARSCSIDDGSRRLRDSAQGPDKRLAACVVRRPRRRLRAGRDRAPSLEARPGRAARGARARACARTGADRDPPGPPRASPAPSTTRAT